MPPAWPSFIEGKPKLLQDYRPAWSRISTLRSSAQFYVAWIAIHSSVLALPKASLRHFRVAIQCPLRWLLEKLLRPR
jgi:hypothetical protein